MYLLWILPVLFAQNDPAMIPGWDSPTSPNFAALCLEPWRLRVFPGTVLMGKGGDVLTWTE